MNAWQQFIQTITPESRLRLAPTPSGYLHMGNLVHFVLVQIAAHTADPPARLLLRIDDIDSARKRPEYVRDIIESLSWVGIHWDEGPENEVDFEANWSQHKRLPHYHDAIEQLRACGLLFACKISRKELAPFNGDYPAAFRDQRLSLDDPDVAWRIKTPEGFPLPDFVVRRRDGLPAYQIASLVDDRLFKITHLIRGEDLRPSTIAQQYLAECLGWDDFLRIPVFHHPLLTDASGEKISKSAGAQAQPLRESGIPAERIKENALALLEVI